jgi:hypothetical protein
MRWSFSVRRLLPVAFAVLAVALAGCGLKNSTATTSTTSPSTTTPTTESFTRTLALGGNGIDGFVVSTAGSVTLSLTAVSPLSTMALGVALGTWDTTSLTCGTIIVKNDYAKSGTTALTGTATAGNYCVKVYDSGNVPSDWTVSYTVQVVHP